jgi:hypothetical protein
VRRTAVSGCGYQRDLNPLRESAMNDLESNLNKILEEHQHESGLHVIGGRRRLIDRLKQFFEDEGMKTERQEPRLGREQQN